MKKFASLLLFTTLLTFQTACDEEDDTGTSPEVNGVAVVETFLERFQQESPSVFELFDESSSVTIMTNPDASQDPIVYDGIGAIEAYISQTFAIFSPIRFTDVRITAADNGATVFVQAYGQFTVEETGTPYNNVYVFRVDVNERGQIASAEEYLNWVVNGEFLGQPLGSCQERICR